MNRHFYAESDTTIYAYASRAAREADIAGRDLRPLRADQLRPEDVVIRRCDHPECRRPWLRGTALRRRAEARRW